MADQCSTCFFGQTTESILGTTQRLCRRNAPNITVGGSLVQSETYTWPTVEDTDWCGQGCDSATGASFALLTFQGGAPTGGNPNSFG